MSNGTPILYYTVSHSELYPEEMPDELPLLLSAASYVTERKDGYHLPPVKQPLPRGLKGADCGGFVAALKWEGEYRFTPVQYIEWLYSWFPDWAATFDLPCVIPVMNEKGKIIPTYPGKEVVKTRQQFTTQMAENFWVRYRDVPWAWCPSIQGFYPEEYEAHARQLATSIRAMYAYYSDPGWLEDLVEDEERTADPSFRVGIGSLVGRARIPFLLEVIERVQAIIGDDIPLHLWGVKLGTLKKGVKLRRVVSVDTGAWNGAFGPEEHKKRRESGLKQVQYAWKKSYPDYKGRVDKALTKDQQPVLFYIHDSQVDWRGNRERPYKLLDPFLHDEEDTLDWDPLISI